MQSTLNDQSVKCSCFTWSAFKLNRATHRGQRSCVVCLSDSARLASAASSAQQRPYSATSYGCHDDLSEVSKVYLDHMHLECTYMIEYVTHA